MRHSGALVLILSLMKIAGGLFEPLGAGAIRQRQQID
jgi:hypothetical protein